MHAAFDGQAGTAIQHCCIMGEQHCFRLHGTVAKPPLRSGAEHASRIGEEDDRTTHVLTRALVVPDEDHRGSPTLTLATMHVSAPPAGQVAPR